MANKIIKLTESDLTRLVKKVIGLAAANQSVLPTYFSIAQQSYSKICF